VRGRARCHDGSRAVTTLREPEGGTLNAAGMAKVATALLVVGSTMASGEGAPACYCSPPRTDAENIRRASQTAPAVFVGQVSRISAPKPRQVRRCLDRGESMCHGRRTKFRVLQAWKGVDTRIFTLIGTGSNCDYPFEVGREYLVYAGVFEGGPRNGATICGLTRLLSRAKLDMEVLGPPAFEPEDRRWR